MPVDLPDPSVLVAGATSAQQRLVTTIEPLTDDLARRPSHLDGWTVGHVLTHIARNADSLVRLLDGALVGEQRVQYPGGRAQRAADIEAGSGRHADELVADVQAACRRFAAACAAMTDAAWTGGGVFDDGTPWPAPLVVFHRWREVEVHHADLDLGYRPEDWSDDYVAIELARQLSILPDRVDSRRRHDLTAWLLGRRSQPDVDPLVSDVFVFRV